MPFSAIVGLQIQPGPSHAAARGSLEPADRPPGRYLGRATT